MMIFLNLISKIALLFLFQMVFNSLRDFLVPESRANPFLFNNEIAKAKPLTPDPFDLNRTSETGTSCLLFSLILATDFGSPVDASIG